MKAENGPEVVQGEGSNGVAPGAGEAVGAAFRRIRLREGCALNALTVAQQEQLFDWLELHPVKVVLEMVAAEPPEGFGLKTHLTTLRRFHLRAGAQLKEQLRSDLAEALGGGEKGDQAAMKALQESTLEMALLQRSNPGAVSGLGRWLLRLEEKRQRDRELDLLERRLAFEREKYEFDAARELGDHYHEIKEIMERPAPTDEEKMWAIREKVFGPRSDLVEPKE